MISSNKKGVQILVEQCISHGIRHIVFSPGSRNAPLIIAFDEHPDVNCIIIHDERSAAFYALGMAQQLNEPVGVVCTSGSAALNYYPAVAEAYYQCVPLVVITADRPSEWVDQGDGQTIVQTDVYKNHIRYSCSLSEDIDHEDDRWHIEREISTAFNFGNGNWKGPIHLNMSFREPLYGKSEVENIKTKVIHTVQSNFKLKSDERETLQKIWDHSPKKMVICGQLPVDKELLEQFIHLASDPSVSILVENTSNIVDGSLIHCIDRTLNAISESELEEYSPDLLIIFGGAVVSKRIKSYLRKYKAKYTWKVGYDFPYMDTYQSLTHTFECHPLDFLLEINTFESSKISSDFGKKWKSKDLVVQGKLEDFFKEVNYSDIKVFHSILANLPTRTNLHMANSSVVRYCQLFDPRATVNYWSNRGTSGIDGSTSTACGAALIDPSKWNVLITGDISFFYDSNALWSNFLSSNIRIFMINNGGGGIFKIIPGPNSTDQLDNYFVAKHIFTAEHICKAFNVDYFSANSIDEIENQMSEFYERKANSRPKLMEIFTPSESNHKELELFFEKMK